MSGEKYIGLDVHQATISVAVMDSQECRVRVKWVSVLLDPQPSLLILRRRYPVFVRMIHRYYAAVLLLQDLHAGPAA